eukprot:g11020.t1
MCRRDATSLLRPDDRQRITSIASTISLPQSLGHPPSARLSHSFSPPDSSMRSSALLALILLAPMSSACVLCTTPCHRLSGSDWNVRFVLCLRR